MLLLFPTFSKLGMVADYLLNKDYYAKILCENQDKPELECEGKCALMLKIQQTEPIKDFNTIPLELLSKVQFDVFVPTACLVFEIIIFEQFKKANFNSLFFSPSGFSSTLQVPPDFFSFLIA